MHDPTIGLRRCRLGHRRPRRVRRRRPAGRSIVEFDVAHTRRRAGRAVPTARARRRAPGGDRTTRRARSSMPCSRPAWRSWSCRSRSVKALRERYGTSGNKSDRSDAYVLADCLRTDGHRWRSPASPTRPATVTLRTHVRARKDLVETRVAVANQLRAHLRDRVPRRRRPVPRPRQPDLACGSSSGSRRPTRAAWLSEKRLGAWLRANGYCGRKTAAELYARLDRRARRPRPATKATPAAPSPSPTSPSSRRCAPRSTSSTPASPSSSTPTPTRHIFRSLPRSRHRPRRHPARRDRRLPRPLPRPRVARLPRRRRPLHPRQRPPPRRHLPLEQRQEAPRRALRLRRRQLARQRLGRRTATANSAPTARPTPTPNASSPAAGPTSSGAAGKTTPPTTPPATAPTNASPTQAA